MDRLSAMRTFVAVVETGGFSRAAQKLGMANASVTEAVKQLEEHLGVLLLNRTTRSVRPTYEGGFRGGRAAFARSTAAAPATGGSW